MVVQSMSVAEGKIRIGPSGTQVEQRLGKGTLDVGGELGKDTNSTTGKQVHRQVVNYDDKFTGELFLTASDDIEAIFGGRVFGQEVYLDLRMGDGKAYLDWLHVIETVGVPTMDPDGLCKVSFTSYAQVPRPAPATWT